VLFGRTVGATSKKVSRLGRCDSSNVVESGEKVLPCAALLDQDLMSGGCDLIETAAPLSGLLNPATLDQRAFFEAVKKRVERGNVKLEHAVRAGFDELGNLVPMASAFFDERENEHLSAAALQLPIQHSNLLQM